MIRNNHQKVVIFDLGNVVLNWDIDSVLDSLNLEEKKAELLRNELFLHQDWQDLDHGKLSEPEVVARICTESELDKTTIEEALLAAKNSLRPIDKTLELMQEISEKGIEMYCLSNMSRETYDHIKNYAFFDLFSGIIISGIEGCRKPFEDIFHLILKRFKLDPSNALFIDDTLPNIETAKRLGFHALHFKRSPACYAEIRNLTFCKT